MTPDVFDRHDGGPHGKVHVVPHPAQYAGQRLPCDPDRRRRNRDDGAVATEDKGQVVLLKRVEKGGNHAGAGHVDRLVATCVDCAGGIDDIGHGQHPAIRQRFVSQSVRDIPEIMQNRQALKEFVICVGHGINIVSSRQKSSACRTHKYPAPQRHRTGKRPSASFEKDGPEVGLPLASRPPDIDGSLSAICPYALKKASRSALMMSAWVVAMPCGRPS